MNHALILSAATVALGLSACGQADSAPPAEMAPAAERTMGSNMSGMAMKGDQAATMGTGSGVITAVDAAAGTVTIDHGAIPAVDWPAMAMTFTAPAAVLGDAKVGDRVAFDVSVHNGINEVTALRALQSGA